MADCTNCQFKAEAERERAWHDRVLKSAQEIYGEDCVRYKLSLFKNGRAMNHFPRELDGHWFAFQRAEDDGHMGLVAMLEAQKDEIERLRGERKVLLGLMDEMWELLNQSLLETEFEHADEERMLSDLLTRAGSAMKACREQQAAALSNLQSTGTTS